MDPTGAVAQAVGRDQLLIMFSRINDGIGRTLLVVFLIKPLVDLAYFLSFPLGGFRLGPLHVFAGLLFFVLLRYRFQAGRNTPPLLALIETFIGLHLISILIGIDANPRLTFIQVIDYMLRVLDSVLIYVAAYLAAIRYRYRDATPFIKAIVIGSSIAVVLNVIAIQLGISPGVWEEKAGSAAAAEFRVAGLYYDPGVLANVAFFNATFVIFLLHLTPKRSTLLVVAAVLLAIADLYLIGLSRSRAGMLQLAIFGLIYLWVFQKGWRRIFAPIAAAVVLGGAVSVLGIDLEDLFVRFESDVTAIEGDVDVSLSSGGEVSLGALEGIGSNRGALWADALTKIVNKPLAQILFGDFSISVSHSDYIDILSRTGLVSLILYLAVILGLTAKALRLSWSARNPHDRTLYFMAFTLLLCYLFYSFPFRPLNYTTTSWYMWAVIGLAMARSRLSDAEALAAARKASEAREKNVAETAETVRRGPNDTQVRRGPAPAPGRPR